MLFNTSLRKIPVYLLYLLVVLIPFDVFAIGPIIILFSLSSIIWGDKSNWTKYFLKNKNYYLPLLIYYCIYIIGFLMSENSNQALKYLEHKLSFFIFPLILPLLHLRQKEIINLFMILTYVCFFIVMASLVDFLYIDITQDEFIILGEKEWGNRVGTRQEYLSKHFLLTKGHRTFFSILLIIVVWFLFIYLNKFYHFLSKKSICLFCFTIFILFSAILLMQSKLSILVLTIVIIMISTFLGYKTRRRYVLGLFGILISLLFIFRNVLIVRFDKMLEDVEYIMAPGTDQSKVFTQKLRPSSSEIRYMLYKSSIQLIKESILFGYGSGDIKEKLTEQNYKNEYLSIAHLNYGVHSQFFHSWLNLGIFGFLSFCLLFILPLKKKIFNRDWFSCGIILIFFITCLFESYLNGRAGIIPFTLIICLMPQIKWSYK